MYTEVYFGVRFLIKGNYHVGLGVKQSAEVEGFFTYIPVWKECQLLRMGEILHQASPRDLGIWPYEGMCFACKV